MEGMPDFWFQKCPASFIIDRENGSGKRLKNDGGR